MARNDTLYVTDLDGTLLNNDSVISSYSRDVLNRLADLGASITFATARTPATVVEIFDGVNLKVPGIVMTGAATFDLQSREYGNKKFLDRNVVNRVLKVYGEDGLAPFVYTWRPDNILHAYHSLAMDDLERSFYEIRRNMSLKRFHLDEEYSAGDLDHTLLIFSVGERRRLKNLIPALEEAAGYKVSYYNDIFSENAGFIEVFAKDVSKATAIEELKRQRGFKRVVAFGDNLNDISMFEVADLGVAVDNAFPEVKERADVIIPANTADSVVDFIYSDFTENLR